MTPFTPFSARVTVLDRDDVDTDQIIPARFLKGTVKTGLGQHLFTDAGVALDAGAQILVAGANFGCGSSREHAVWALADRGFRAIIARSFADIFRANATKNGLLPIALPDAACVRIAAASEVRIDLDAVVLGDGTAFAFALDPFAKHCLATGLDELGYILTFLERITTYEQRRD